MDFKLLATMLKDLDQNSDLNRVDYDLDQNDFSKYVEAMKDEGFAENVSVIRGGMGNKVQGVLTNGGKVTFRGHNFIKENL